MRRVGGLPMTSGLPDEQTFSGFVRKIPFLADKARRLAIIAGSASGFDLHHGVAAPEPVHRAVARLPTSVVGSSRQLARCGVMSGVGGWIGISGPTVKTALMTQTRRAVGAPSRVYSRTSLPIAAEGIAHRLSPERGAGTMLPFGIMPFRNLKRSLSVERTRVVFSAMIDLYDCIVRVNS